MSSSAEGDFEVAEGKKEMAVHDDTQIESQAPSIKSVSSVLDSRATENRIDERASLLPNRRFDSESSCTYTPEQLEEEFVDEEKPTPPKPNYVVKIVPLCMAVLIGSLSYMILALARPGSAHRSFSTTKATPFTYAVVGPTDANFNKNAFEIKEPQTAPFADVGDFDGSQADALETFAKAYLHEHNKDGKKRLVVNDKDYDESNYAKKFQKWYVWHPDRTINKPLQTVDEFVRLYSRKSEIRLEEGHKIGWKITGTSVSGDSPISFDLSEKGKVLYGMRKVETDDDTVKTEIRLNWQLEKISDKPWKEVLQLGHDDELAEIDLTSNFMMTDPDGIQEDAVEFDFMQLTNKDYACFGIFIGTIVGVMTAPLPLGATALLGMAVALLSQQVSLKEATSGFTNGTPWIILVAYCLAIPFISSGLGKRLSLHCVGLFGKSSLGLVYALGYTETLCSLAIPSVS
jgi:hypothetical protein